MSAGLPVRGRSPWVTGLVLLLFAILVCTRMPEIILKGRFWAEEGRYFLVDAWTMTPSQALLAPVGGYLNIIANASLLAARWLLPLQWAPYLTISIALLVQLLPPLLLLTARDAWLEPLLARIAAVALVLLVPNADEIWLQTLHCQFELTLCCAIILCLDTVRGPAALGRMLILLLAPLCGPGAIALLPLFGLRLLSDRSGARLGQCLCLGAGAATQLLLFMSTASGRAYAFDPVVLLCILTVRHLALPFLGQGYATALAAAVRARLASSHFPHLALLLLPVMVLPVLVFGPAGLLCFLGRPSRPAVWLLLSGLFIAGLSYYGAIGTPADLVDVRFGERYAFVPEALFSLMLLVLALTVTGRVSWLLYGLLAWQMTSETARFQHKWAFVADGPGWRPEVAAWRADPTRALRLWPDGWSMRLAPDHHPMAEPAQPR